MKSFIGLIVLGLVLGLMYCWFADNNRYGCAVLWFVAPILSIIYYGIFEKQIMNAIDSIF